MRYLFKGLIRANGNTVEGHVEAPNPDEAINTLSLNGIVTESLRPNPKPLDLAQEMRAAPQMAGALDSAFDSSSSQVPFDSLSDRYRGKNVWVIDRDKIRRRVAQVVDGAISDAFGAGGGGLDPSETMIRGNVQAAISGMFVDNQNIASSMTLQQVEAAKRAADAPAGTAASSPAMEEQIDRMANVVKQAEMVLAQIQAAARGIRFGGGGGGGGFDGPRRGSMQGRSNMNDDKNDVLLEIFKSNMKLQRGVMDSKSAATAPAAAAETGE